MISRQDAKLGTLCALRENTPRPYDMTFVPSLLLRRFPVKLEITVTTHARQREDDQVYWRKQTEEARLDMVETLRMEAGKFLYEYPARLRRVVTITRKA